MPVDIQSYYKLLITSDIERKKYGAYQGHPLREMWARVREESGWHRHGEVCKRLYRARHPSEPEMYYDWKCENHEGITTGEFAKAVASVARTTTSANWQIIFYNDDQKEQFLGTHTFGQRNFIGWLREDYVKGQLFLDPNAVYVPFPHEDGAKNIFVPSGRIIDNNEKFVAWLDYVPTDMGKGGKGRLYHVIDDTYFYEVREMAPDQFDVVITFTHGGGRCWETVGGIKVYVGSDFYYRNFLFASFKWGNEALKWHADAAVVAKNMAFPIIETFERTCGTCNGSGMRDDYGTLLDSGGYAKIKCGHCNNGIIREIPGPGEAIWKKQPSDMGETFGGSQTMAKLDGIKFHSPPVDALESLDKRWKDPLENFKDSLGRKIVLEPQSGRAKEADKEDQFITVTDIGEHIWGVFAPNAAMCYLKIVQPNFWERVTPQMLIPTDFKLISSADLLEKIKVAKEAELPASVYSAHVRQYIQKEFKNNPEQLRKFEIIFALDKLAYMDVEAQNLLSRMGGGVADGEIFASAHTEYIVDDIIRENPLALDWDIARWKTAFLAKLEEMAPEPDPEPELQDIVNAD